MSFVLHALKDDFSLNANGDTERGDAITALYLYFLTDPQGDFLIDPQGDFLVGYKQESVSPQILHALPDNLLLNAE